MRFPYFWWNQIKNRKVKRKKDEKLRRIHRTSLLFNSREQEAINLFYKKYKVSNKSKFMREAIITEVLKRFDEDYPTLF